MEPLDQSTRQGDIALATEQAEVEHIRIALIKIDGGTQMRAMLDSNTVSEYADVFYAQKRVLDWSFPPLVVFYDGQNYWLADGFHRLAAFRKNLHIDARNLDVGHTVPAFVRAGSRRDAILYAVSANADHGLRRTSADKRRAVETLLRDEEWRVWTDMEIARKCRVDAKTVGNIRRQLTTTLEIPVSTVRHSADGRTLNVANIGKRPAMPAPALPAKAVYFSPEPRVEQSPPPRPAVEAAAPDPPDIAEPFIWESAKFSPETDSPSEPLPVPVNDVEILLRSYDGVHGYRQDARLLTRRVQRWLDSLPKEEPTP